MAVEHSADDVARCFALRALIESDPEQSFAGEVTGLISAGAFVAFSVHQPRVQAQSSPPAFEGMLPVRKLGSPDASERAGHRERRGRHERQPAMPQREWWEMNPEGTILRGERTGAAIRLGDPIEVRVARVDTVRGRVDLLPGG